MDHAIAETITRRKPHGSYATLLWLVAELLLGTVTTPADAAARPGEAEARLPGARISAHATGSHTCAVKADGGVRCWGVNASGQLGDGTTIERSQPVQVAGLGGVVAVAAGGFHTCALHVNGSVSCWGLNSSGQLGDGTTTQRNAPVQVTGLTEVVAIAGGQLHTCALLSGGTVQCWGLNSSGQLGNGTTIPVNTAPFQPGPATAEAEAVISERGQVVDTEEWTREVMLTVTRQHSDEDADRDTEEHRETRRP
jgi:hypothetical protein